MPTLSQQQIDELRELYERRDDSVVTWNLFAMKMALHFPVLVEAAAVAEMPFDFSAHLSRQREWSLRTFGPGNRTAGVLDHIRKELLEIGADPLDLNEWIDVVILALDGAWRAGHLPHEIIAALRAKQAKNENRVWPDWRTMPSDKAIEHKREDQP